MARDLALLWPPRDGGAVARLVAIALLLLNLPALWMVLRPPGGSPAELQSELADLRAQARQRRDLLARTRLLATRVESGRSSGQRFMDRYFLDRRSAASTIAGELVDDAHQAGITLRDASYPSEPVEGSDNLSMMTVAANFDGSYADLIHLLDRIDKSSRLLIVDSLQAVPQQGSGRLNIGLRFDVFVREYPDNLVAEAVR
ncbi:MAG: GspMb/PilO family protein [Bryobacteraceae bacterium]